jgi:DNA-binding NarL/FixJ family response regulator
MGQIAPIRAPDEKLTTLGRLLHERDEMIALYQALPQRIREKQVAIDQITAPQHAALMLLSPRQREVLELVLCEMSNKEIGNRLHIAERTVKFHVSGLLEKFGKTTRKELLR